MESSIEFGDTDRRYQVLQTDMEILLRILPSCVWANISQVLEKKHPSSLGNLSNSSLYFRNLTLSKRSLFLFPQVFKLMDPQFGNNDTTKIEGTKCRTISKSWTKGVDQFITDGTPVPEFFNTAHPPPSDHVLTTTRYQYFGHDRPNKLAQFLAHFQQTHLPHSPRNPFIGKVVFIDLIGFTDQTKWASIADQVSTLLRKYGHHIKILNLGLFNLNRNRDPNVQSQNHLWLLEWLENCPNLTYLKVSEQYSVSDDVDSSFGKRPDLDNIRLIRRITGSRSYDLCIHYRNSIEQAFILFKQRKKCENGSKDSQHKNPDLSIPHANHRDVTPMLAFKKLQCLKLCHVSALNFNSIIFANTHVVWLHIEPLNVDKHLYINYLALEFPNLKKLYIKLSSQKEVRKLKDIHQSWLSLTHLHFDYCMSSEFMEWIEIFELICQNWGATLTDLKLRLPMAKTEGEMEKVARDSDGKFRLELPNLKRLKIWLNDESGAGVAKTDFLDLLRMQLEELIIE